MLVGLLDPLSGTKHSFFPSQEYLLLQASKLVPPCLEKGTASQGLTGATTRFPKTTYPGTCWCWSTEAQTLGSLPDTLEGPSQVQSCPWYHLRLLSQSHHGQPLLLLISAPLIPCKYSPFKQISNQSQLSGESHLDMQHL